jgi:S-adenosylmethionine synthetase
MRTSEYVSIGHPDRVADYIGAYILDRLIEQDPMTRAGIEVQIKGQYVSLAGEVTTNAKTAYPLWVRDAVIETGYTDKYCKIWGSENVINPQALDVSVHIDTQSPDIAQGVDNDGWGDQGIFWSMATPKIEFNYLPFDYWMAKRLAKKLYSRCVEGCGIDIKTQITVDEKEDIAQAVVAIPCKNESAYQSVRTAVRETLNAYGRAESIKDENIIVNGTGVYVKHGPIADAGVLGRKLVVDAYGGNCKIGGGAYHGKDCTKADVSLNLHARALALKWAIKLKKTVFAELSCVIGRGDVNITIRDENNKIITSMVESLPPSKVIEIHNLRRPMYANMVRKGMSSIQNINWVD